MIAILLWAGTVAVLIIRRRRYHVQPWPRGAPLLVRIERRVEKRVDAYAVELLWLRVWSPGHILHDRRFVVLHLRGGVHASGTVRATFTHGHEHHHQHHREV